MGVKNPKRLLEDIPNKIKGAMNIALDVNLIEEDELPVIEIVVPKYPAPVLCRGVLYYRSGATLQRLTGSDLERFIMMKRGWQWDMTPVPGVMVEDLENSAIQYFRDNAIKAKRLKEEYLAYTNAELLDKLGLIENGFLTIAAVMLFHAHPEKWVVGAYTKIGYFADSADIAFQDVVDGPLIYLPDKVVDLIYTKYLRAVISYDGIHRIESYPYPREAIREAALNAITNKRYEQGVPVQIRIYDDHAIFFNDGQLPENWTVDTLFATHKSIPYNPLIANAYYYAGFIESWGRGIEKMVKSCKADNIPTPEFDVTAGDINLTFTTIPERVIHMSIESADSINDTDLGQGDKNPVIDDVIERNKELFSKILTQIERKPTITIKELAATIGVSDRQIARKIKELKKLSIIQRAGSDRGGHWIIR